jgi:hypothetical protein
LPYVRLPAAITAFRNAKYRHTLTVGNMQAPASDSNLCDIGQHDFRGLAVTNKYKAFIGKD